MAKGAPVAPDYIIGPGDELQVFVWRNPDLTVTVPVRPDGKISTPLDEDMPAVGKSPFRDPRDPRTRPPMAAQPAPGGTSIPRDPRPPAPESHVRTRPAVTYPPVKDPPKR